MTFAAGVIAPESIDVNLNIQDDLIPGEDTERFNLTIGQPSQPSVQIGGAVGGTEYFHPAMIDILDDDGTVLVARSS